MWRNYNHNPLGARVGDCTVRAISRATDKSWEETYIGLCLTGLCVGDMPSSNAVWGAYLKRCGFHMALLPDTCPDCYTISAFAKEHPKGVYIAATGSHVVCVKDGDWYDTWDSGDEIPTYYWTKEEA